MDTGAINISASTAGAAAPDPGAMAARSIAREQQATTETRAAAKLPTESLSPSRVRETAESLGRALTSINRGIHFEIDDSTDRVITTIIDKETREVIRQIPPEEVLEISQRLRTFMGVLLDTEV